MKRYIALIIFIIFSAVALSLAFVSSADGSVPIMYRNDTKYNITEYPVEIIDGKVHVPVSFFIGLNGIQYVYASDPAGFYLRNTSTGRFFSFSANADAIIVDSELVNIKFPIANSTVYLPLEYCADILSLSVEKSTHGNEQRIRLTDGTQKLAFDDLIELYDPTEKPSDNPIITPENPSDILPENPSQPETPLPPEQAQRYAYITVDVLNGNDVCDVIDELKNSNTAVTFFFDYDSIASHPECVIKAFVSGHGIGIYLDETSEADKTNDILYSVINTKTRLYRTATPLSTKETEVMTKKGYIQRKYDLIADITDEKQPKQIARDLYNGTFKKEHTVISIRSAGNTAEAIHWLIDYINGDDHLEAQIIDPTVSI
ncbi:MAG: hypothetical protein E7613_09470 [Ruminococcaceae bacterium]|nr:hypothetical protein [Oscillospiraceae bacterium]